MTPLVWTLFAAVFGGTPDRSPVTAPVPIVHSQRLLLVVVGAEGTRQYGREFSQWAARWERAAHKGGVRFECIGRDSIAADGIGAVSRERDSDRQRLRKRLAATRTSACRELWLVLIGHGTFDGRTAKFNLRGPDVSAAELRQWLAPRTAPAVVINCASCSGPFISSLSAENRVVVTATKSGFERNYARFGGYLSQAIADPDADLDKDGQTSLLEAWLAASRRTQQFYRLEGRLPTEHALLEDNGDGLAARAGWFRGVRPVRKPTGKASVDGFRAHQFHLVRSPHERRIPPELRRKRDELERAVIRLRERKADLPDDEYYPQLETLLLPLAELYERADAMDEPGS